MQQGSLRQTAKLAASTPILSSAFHMRTTLAKDGAVTPQIPTLTVQRARNTCAQIGFKQRPMLRQILPRLLSQNYTMPSVLGITQSVSAKEEPNLIKGEYKPPQVE